MRAQYGVSVIALSGVSSYEILYTVVKKGNSASIPFILRMWFTYTRRAADSRRCACGWALRVCA